MDFSAFAPLPVHSPQLALDDARMRLDALEAVRMHAQQPMVQARRMTFPPHPHRLPPQHLQFARAHSSTEDGDRASESDRLPTTPQGALDALPLLPHQQPTQTQAQVSPDQHAMVMRTVYAQGPSSLEEFTVTPCGVGKESG